MRVGLPVLFVDASASSLGLPVVAAEIRRRARLHDALLVLMSGPSERRALAVRRANEASISTSASERALIAGMPEIEAAGGLAVALSGVGLPATVLDPRQVGPVCRGSSLSAEPRRLFVSRVLASFDATPVAILPAGLGLDENRSPVHLGVGGEALSAVFCADRLASSLTVIRSGEPAVDPAAPGLGLLPRRAALAARRLGVRVSVQPLGDAKPVVMPLEHAARWRDTAPVRPGVRGGSGSPAAA